MLAEEVTGTVVTSRGGEGRIMAGESLRELLGRGELLYLCLRGHLMKLLLNVFCT